MSKMTDDFQVGDRVAYKSGEETTFAKVTHVGYTMVWIETEKMKEHFGVKPERLTRMAPSALR